MYQYNCYSCFVWWKTLLNMYDRMHPNTCFGCSHQFVRCSQYYFIVVQWRHMAILAQIMARGLTVLNHYLYKGSLLISDVAYHSHQSNFTASAQVTALYEFENRTFNFWNLSFQIYNKRHICQPQINKTWMHQNILLWSYCTQAAGIRVRTGVKCS